MVNIPTPEWTKQLLAEGPKAEASVSVSEPEPQPETSVPEDVQDEIRELAAAEAEALVLEPPEEILEEHKLPEAAEELEAEDQTEEAEAEPEAEAEELESGEVSGVVPLAVPLLAGPGAISTTIIAAQARALAHLAAMIRQHRENMAAIRASFAADKARYLELTAGKR